MYKKKLYNWIAGLGGILSISLLCASSNAFVAQKTILSHSTRMLNLGVKNINTVLGNDEFDNYSTTLSTTYGDPSGNHNWNKSVYDCKINAPSNTFDKNWINNTGENGSEFKSTLQVEQGSKGGFIFNPNVNDQGQRSVVFSNTNSKQPINWQSGGPITQWRLGDVPNIDRKTIIDAINKANGTHFTYSDLTIDPNSYRADDKGWGVEWITVYGQGNYCGQIEVNFTLPSSNDTMQCDNPILNFGVNVSSFMNDNPNWNNDADPNLEWVWWNEAYNNSDVSGEPTMIFPHWNTSIYEMWDYDYAAQYHYEHKKKDNDHPGWSGDSSAKEHLYSGQTIYAQHTISKFDLGKSYNNPDFSQLDNTIACISDESETSAFDILDNAINSSCSTCDAPLDDFVALGDYKCSMGFYTKINGHTLHSPYSLLDFMQVRLFIDDNGNLIPQIRFNLSQTPKDLLPVDGKTWSVSFAPFIIYSFGSVFFRGWNPYGAIPDSHQDWDALMYNTTDSAYYQEYKTYPPMHFSSKQMIDLTQFGCEENYIQGDNIYTP